MCCDLESCSIQIPPDCFRCCMFDPQNKWQAASIFLAGIVVSLARCWGAVLCRHTALPVVKVLMASRPVLQVIGWTVLDVHRTTRLNEQPMTPEQQRVLTERVQAAEDSHVQQTLQQLKRG